MLSFIEFYSLLQIPLCYRRLPIKSFDLTGTLSAQLNAYCATLCPQLFVFERGALVMCLFKESNQRQTAVVDETLDPVQWKLDHSTLAAA